MRLYKALKAILAVFYYIDIIGHFEIIVKSGFNLLTLLTAIWALAIIYI